MTNRLPVGYTRRQDNLHFSKNLPTGLTVQADPNVQQDDIIIDGSLLMRVFRRQLLAWLWKGLLLFGLLLLLALFLVPRTYTSSVSVAVQQPAGGGALAALTGGGGSTRRYLGILKSRQTAEQVERHVHLQQLYGSHKFPTEEEAVQFLMKSVKPDDNAADGLLYIAVTLPGQPKLSLSHSPREADVENAAALAANDYALALKEYYATSDTDQGAVLLRGADKEVLQARADYNDALERALDFSRGLSGVDPRSAPTSGQSGADTGGAGDALGTLYTALAGVQAELKADQAARQTRDSLTEDQIRNLSSVPTDDPLLATARSQVTQDQAAYDSAVKLYGPENPLVIKAQTQLEVDQGQLAQQIQGVKRRLTTPNVRSDEQIQSLYARQAVLLKQVAQAGRRLGVRRELSGAFTRLQTEVTLRLAVLNTTMTEAAKVRLENASAGSRMSVVDTALPPKFGEPGPLRIGAACLALVILAFLIAVIRDYLRQGRRTSGERGSLNSPPNGSGPKLEPLAETAAMPTRNL